MKSAMKPAMKKKTLVKSAMKPAMKSAMKSAMKPAMKSAMKPAMKKKTLVQRKKGKFVKRDFQKTVKIGGKTLDFMMLEAAKIATSGKGDGRISAGDAQLICKAARPSTDGRSTYDKLEKATMAYVRKTFKFT